ncbi:hypothetical protein EGR_05401 [Echinococcus granulosus]|uniref:Uncharacterized protein n=1 Tax=Echinococcus granulosus TaxID=6210 RepID=W6UFS2_ECHGR|nr:hypothetical protein EGR_05401 [Echinococcus granulosus]EUB59781.1 hypothetical protein EGR_05401 [Echinococcus granulosus]
MGPGVAKLTNLSSQNTDRKREVHALRRRNHIFFLNLHDCFQSIKVHTCCSGVRSFIAMKNDHSSQHFTTHLNSNKLIRKEEIYAFSFLHNNYLIKKPIKSGTYKNTHFAVMKYQMREESNS